jgi:LacI family transcriptional regulator
MMPRIAVAIELDWPVRQSYDAIQGIQRFADDAGDWELDIGPFPEVRLRTGRRYDGIVGRITPAMLDAARAANIPIVNMWLNSPVAGKMPNVQVDPHAAGRIAAEHLYARGLRRFVHVGSRRQAATRTHYEGVAAVAKELGCPLQRLRISADFESAPLKWERFAQRLHKAAGNWQTPIGVTTTQDSSARAMIMELQLLGLEVPHDVAVVGCQNHETYCAHLFPTLSSVDYGYVRNGYEAGRLLAGLMRGEAPPTEVVRVSPKELVVRDSSDFFAVNDVRVAEALRFMAEHSAESISVTKVAQAAGISQQSLNKLFHHHVGHTVNTELIRLRVEHFKRLLVGSDESAKKLYALSGFGTESLAYHTFKRLTGQTPAQYREERKGRGSRDY